MSWKSLKTIFTKRQMVECSECSVWLHRMCEQIPDAVFGKKKIYQNAIGCVISAHQKELKLHVIRYM